MPKYELPPELRSYVNGAKKNIGIPPEELWLSDFRAAMRSDLNRQLKGHFWVSDDISITEDVVLGPDGQGLPFVEVDLPEDLGPFKDMDPYALTSLAKLTARSRFAQLGMDVKEGFSSQNHVWLTNYAHRPIYLPQGTAVCYMYYWDEKYLEGHDLEDAVGSRIKIDGVEGSDWRPWYGSNTYNPDKQIRGLEFFIDPRSRKHIPRVRKVSLDHQIMTLDDGPSRNHSRNLVDRYLEKVPHKRDRKHLVISETLAELELDPTIHGLCDSGVGFNRWPVGVFEGEDFQINSILLRGGNTYGKFRTEVWEGTGGKPPETVLARFVNA